MYAIAWIPSEQCEGKILRQMAHGAEISWKDNDGWWQQEYFDLDDYVILVDVDSELEGD